LWEERRIICNLPLHSILKGLYDLLNIFGILSEETIGTSSHISNVLLNSRLGKDAFDEIVIDQVSLS
jgi:hypothetical protein